MSLKLRVSSTVALINVDLLIQFQYNPNFSYEQLSHLILIALRFLSLKNVVYNLIYVTHTAIYIHIYVLVLSLSTL